MTQFSMGPGVVPVRPPRWAVQLLGIWVLRLLLAVVFVGLAWSTVRHPGQFIQAVRGLDRTWDAWQELAANVLAWLAVLASVPLVVGSWRLARLMCRLFMTGVFVAAAVPKIVQPAEFAYAVHRYDLLPESLVNLVAIVLPWTELIAAVALLVVPRMRDAAALILAGLLVVFVTAMTITLARGLELSCGCFTVDPDADPLGFRTVLRDAGLLLPALVTLVAALGPRARPAR